MCSRIFLFMLVCSFCGTPYNTLSTLVVFFLLHIQIVIFPSFHTSFLFLIMKFIKGQGGRKKERNFSFALTDLLHLEMYFFLSWTSGVTVTLNKKTSFNNGFKLHNNFHLIYLFSDSCC